MNRPVIGAHFASLALERACGGRTKAVFEGMEWEEGMKWEEAELALARELEEVAAEGQQVLVGGEWVGREELDGGAMEEEKLEL